MEKEKHRETKVGKVKETKKTQIDGTPKKCNDKDCYLHGNLKLRGRIFKGWVTKKFPKRVAIEFERMIYVRKYERYAKSKTKIHARLPRCLENEINVGDYIEVQECRPLSKIIHFAVLNKLNNSVKSELK